MLGRSLALAAAAMVSTGAAAPLVPGFVHAPDRAHLLATELSCTACHASETIQPKRGPVLDGVGLRLQADWLRDFLTDPQKTKPGTTMPDLFASLPDAERAEKVDALVHYLAVQQGWNPPRLFKYSAPHVGKRLFGTVGCANCHTAPMPGVKAKYAYPALVDFLQNPLKHRPGGRMPDLKLEPQEAADIAAYLIDTLDIAENGKRGLRKPFAADLAKAKLGGELFRSVGCANCHELADITSELNAPVFVPAMPDCKAADYSLDDAQREALSAAPRALDAKQRVTQTMATFNCYACHTRGGVDARGGHFSGDDTLGNEGKFPPHLDGVGAKLTHEWLAKVLAGEGELRPYLDTRMPVFGEANVGHLPALFGEADTPPRGALAGGDAEVGKVLLGTQGGVGCISCHGVGGRQGLAMRSLSLDGATARYHPDWFKRHLIDPMSTRPGTLMPSFWPGGVAGNKTVLGGDTDAQIAAIWAYLDKGGELPPGYPDFDKGDFEIIPEDRPVVQRTMIEGAGTHAIAVGFPEGVHLVFDAEHCRLVAVWRGRFIDGYKAWFSRVEPTTEPLGKAPQFLPEHVPDQSGRWFKGYRLDAGGVPVFLYRDPTGEVAVQFKPDGRGGLEKTSTRDGITRKSKVTW